MPGERRQALGDTANDLATTDSFIELHDHVNYKRPEMRFVTKSINAYLEYMAHYLGERNHQGLDNQLIEFKGQAGQSEGELKQRERLGGMLRYYYRDAA